MSKPNFIAFQPIKNQPKEKHFTDRLWIKQLEFYLKIRVIIVATPSSLGLKIK